MHAYNDPDVVVGIRATALYIVEACGEANLGRARNLAIWAGKTLCWCKRRKYGFESFRTELMCLMAQARVKAH